MKHQESTANTYTEEGKKIEIVALFRVIQLFVKERIIVNPNLEENFE